MSWLPIAVLAAATFMLAAFVLKLPRRLWTLLAAALTFGLAGYAWQGSPGQGGAPAAIAADVSESGEALVNARRGMFPSDLPPPRWITVADAFTRKGRYEDAANMLRNAVAENPGDLEAWLALGNVLVEHADGALTPAATYAYDRAEGLGPDHPGVPFFVGIALLRSGEPQQARDAWAELLARTPGDAPWRSQLEDRVAILNRLLAMQAGRMAAPGGPAGDPPAGDPPVSPGPALPPAMPPAIP